MGLPERVAAALSARAVRRSDPVTLEEFGALLGRGRGGGKTRAGVDIGPQRALGITAWYSGVRYIAETLASLPVHTYRDRPGGRERRSDPPWLRKPDLETVRFSWVEFVAMSLLHRGNGYSFKLRDGLSRVTGLRSLHPDRVRVGQTSDGLKVFQIDGMARCFTSREVLHIPGLSYDGVVGLSPLQCAAEALGAVAAADEYAGRYFGQGPTGGGYIQVANTLTKVQADELRDEWESFHHSLSNAHTTGVLSAGSDYKTIGLSAKDTQLLEARGYGVTEVARMLRVPPHKLYDLTRATFSNIEHQSIEAVVDGIRPPAVRIESFVNADPDLLVAGNGIEFQLEGLLRGDTNSRYESYSSAVGAPWMTGNEARRLENMPPLPGLDVVISPLNMVPADQRAAGDPTSPDPGTQETP